ncbi:MULTISPECIES: hypothetical protein [Pirellulaceae]|uniref:PD-(D/E)XK nuclease domain-containing protein n=1 Tax=Pirellulaceae TaxID=2691357 RepID=UPI0018EDF984|nr:MULTISPECIES: hypothetical protein [Pirellulaceae]
MDRPTPEKAKQMLDDLMQEGEEVQKSKVGLDAWSHKCDLVVTQLFGSESKQVVAFKTWSRINPEFRNAPIWVEHIHQVRDFRNHVLTAIRMLENLKWNIDTFGLPATNTKIRIDAVEVVTEICLRFHSVCRQLRKRYNNRATLDVEDEYDVQDLLHALLLLHFEDVRPEEWTPSHAGAASRIDFLLKSERIVVECKKTRKSLTDKKLGEELIIDIERYRSHPDYRTLICFVYDPSGYVNNARGMENDLSKTTDGLHVKVVVAPK